MSLFFYYSLCPYAIYCHYCLSVQNYDIYSIQQNLILMAFAMGKIYKKTFGYVAEISYLCKIFETRECTVEPV